MSLIKQCRVNGCTFPNCLAGNPHYCRKCQIWGVTHFTSDCPFQTQRRCRVSECIAGPCLAGNKHHCRICNDYDSTHSSKNCPQKQYSTTTIMQYQIPTINNLSHIKIVTVTIFCGNNILVSRRGVNDNDYGKIFSCGGSVDPNESLIDAALRETREECGIILSPTSLHP